ncbi:DMT family transporter [Salidesulfovibrio onnuriiensis]|uniref:DMT family transporter n=1 Tax=Salidesulfovibrio onnuriiensis TaxID=2583823 RepID=UPI0011C96B44|nr:DMT family transporter [Salidesulfovibrio onnuriiensis]
MNRNSTPFVFFLLVLTMALWGGTWVAGRVLATHMAPLSASFLRFFSASVFLVLFVSHGQGGFPKISWRLAPHAAFLGATGVFMYSWFFFKGLQYSTAGRAALIVACIPVCISGLSALLYKERFGPVRIFGTLLSLCGVAVVLSNGNPMTLLRQGVSTGDLLILGCVAAWTAYSLGGRSAMKHLSPPVAVMWSCLFGSAFLFFPALHTGLAEDIARASLTDWGCILYLGVLATGLSYAWYYKGIQAIGPSRAGIFINLVPIFALLFASLMLGEALELSLLLGGCMVIAGVVLTNRT